MVDNKNKRSYDAGHVPITEEFDSPRHTLPAFVPLVIALVAVAIVVAGIFYVFRAKPVAQGGIDQVTFSKQPDQPTAMVAIQVDLRNVTQKPIYIKAITATLKTDQGEWSDDAASSSDYPRYVEAYPDLRDHLLSPLAVETRIMPGTEQRGTVMVAFPVDRTQFDNRKELKVTIEPYDQKPIELKETPPPK